MSTVLARYRWTVDHPLEVLGLLAILLALAYIIGAVVFAAWKANEAKKAHQAQLRIRLERIMQASTPPPRAPGLGSRRIG